MTTAPTALSLLQFLALPDEKPYLEYVEGEVRPKVSPTAKHAFLQRKLLLALDAAGGSGSIAWALPEWRIILGGQSLVPDIAVVMADHVPYGDKGEIAKYLDGPPDITVEIVSPDQSVSALVRRCLW